MLLKIMVGIFRSSTGKKTLVEEGFCMTLWRGRIRQRLGMEMGLIPNSKIREQECKMTPSHQDVEMKDQRLYTLYNSGNLCHFSILLFL